MKDLLVAAALVTLALLACKERDHEPRRKAPPPPSESPAEILARAKKAPLVDGRPVRVTGVATECSGGDEIFCCSLDAGKGQSLRACMRAFMSPVGVSHEDPPEVGKTRTMKCEEVTWEKIPLLRKCEVVR